MGERASQGKVMVDFGSTVGGLGGASLVLQHCKSFNVKPQGSTDVTVAVGGFLGFREKVGGFEIDLEIYTQVGVPEVDWYAVQRDRKKFNLTTQIELGGRRQSFRCMVSKIDEKIDNEGDLMATVTLAATSRSP